MLLELAVISMLVELVRVVHQVETIFLNVLIVFLIVFDPPPEKPTPM